MSGGLNCVLLRLWSSLSVVLCRQKRFVGGRTRATMFVVAVSGEASKTRFVACGTGCNTLSRSISPTKRCFSPSAEIRAPVSFRSPRRATAKCPRCSFSTNVRVLTNVATSPTSRTERGLPDAYQAGATHRPDGIGSMHYAVRSRSCHKEGSAWSIHSVRGRAENICYLSGRITHWCSDRRRHGNDHWKK